MNGATVISSRKKQMAMMGERRKQQDQLLLHMRKERSKDPANQSGELSRRKTRQAIIMLLNS